MHIKANVVPAQCVITFNVQYSHGYISEVIKLLLTQSLNKFSESVVSIGSVPVSLITFLIRVIGAY
jgi:hypothetical protein